ncbi:MAG: nucleotidyltransferase family protein [Erysipelotrichaceae bacterium]|nr:nucleotidyltransferase family protein [Erysipelotrichaceae bacterium]
MNVTGIIVEYNPFHNGHIKHIKEAKKITNSDILIAITSGNFTQRGDVSVLDKFEKTKAALNNGVDLVIELPYIYTVQNSKVFGEKAVELLNAIGINNLVFGSETCNTEELMKYAELNINVDHLKEILDTGLSYPKAYGLLASSLYPNDILAVSYLKAIKGTNIIAYPIKRKTKYHDTKLKKVCSASAIRKALKDKKDYSIATPIKIKNAHFNEELYPYLRRLLFTKSKEELQKIFLVSEGIEGLLIKNAYKYDNYDDFINNSVSKRYTKARIQRVILQIINNIETKDVKALKKLDYIRVLGFNSKGQKYLRDFKSDNYYIVTQFKNIPEEYKNIEWKVSQMYASMLKKPNEYLLKELKGPIIKKSK